MRTPTLAFLVASSSSFAAWSQAPDPEALFAQHCAACVVNPVEDDVPTRAAMRTLAPNAIVDSLTEGTMRLQGQALTPAQRISIAELVTGRPVLAASAPTERGLCTAALLSPTSMQDRYGTAGDRIRATRVFNATRAASRRPMSAT